MTQASPHPPSLDIVFQEVKERLNVQLQQVDTIDAKAGTVLSVASLVMTLGTGLGVAARPQGIDGMSLALVFASAVFYASTMVFGFRGYWLRNFRRDPEPAPLRDGYLFQPPDFTKRRVMPT